VLILGADFAPSSLPPALRIRFFARHLPEFGWRPILITTDPRFYESAVDPENERLVPDGLAVIRTRALEVRLTRRFGVGDVGMRSLWHHWSEIRRLCSKEQVDLVFIPVPPYIPMVLGRLIRKQFGIPYVVDFQDPWVTEYYWQLPRRQRPPKWPLAYAMSRLLEPFALRNASGLVGVSKGTIDCVTERYRWIQGVPTVEIPLGGEPADFEYLTRHLRTQRIFEPNDGLHHISYVGACIPGMYPAVRAVLEAVRSGLGRAPRLFSKLRIHFVGSSYAPPGGRSEAKVAQMAGEFGVAEFVDEQPERVSYLDSLQLLLDSQALLLIGSDQPHYTASKVFPYILSGRPILAVFHKDSSVIGILQDIDRARIVAFDHDTPASSNVELISRYFEEILISPQSAMWNVPGPSFDRYTTCAMAERLASFFDTVLRPSRISQAALVDNASR
jgi:hypothetical protein